MSLNPYLKDIVRDCLQLCILDIDNGGETSWKSESVTKLLGYRWKHLNNSDKKHIETVFRAVSDLYRDKTIKFDTEYQGRFPSQDEWDN